jgi:DMSO/TMAO reductase YedYZ heme-binding membrane subunit
MCIGLLARAGLKPEGWSLVIRATARTSVLLFAAAYAASSLRAFWRNDATKWLLRNRRYVGLSYAVSHTLHLGAIFALARVSPDFEFEPVAVVTGGTAYVLLYLMALTSNDRAVAALGIENWRRLHRVGMHFNWFIFFQAFARRAAIDPFYVPFAALVIGAAGLRFAAWRRRLRPAAAVAIN